MAHRFDFHDSTAGLDFGTIERLFLPPAGFEIANDLFRSGGIAMGTLRYVDAATGQWVTETTWMNAMGLFGTGTPVDVPPVAAGVPDAGDFIGLANGGASGFFRFQGIDAPVLTWDDTAEGDDRDAALAEFAANAAAAQADYQAQLDAVLAQTVQDRFSYSMGGTAMAYRPSEGTALTYGDFVGMMFFPGDGFYALGPFGSQSFGNVFAAAESVELRLTRHDDALEGETFSAGTLIVDAGRGNDRVSLFYRGDDATPGLVVLDGASGDDALRLGAYSDTQVDGGRGRDEIDLTWGLGAGENTRHTLSGGDGQDGLTGAEAGTNLIDGGNGRDLLVGGEAGDTIAGGDGGDFAFAQGGEDQIAGDAGNDVIDAGDGADTLDGGTDRDVLSGGAGADVFAFGPGAGRDTITDYEAGEALLFDAGYWSGSVAEFVAAQVRVNAAGALTIRLSDTDRVHLDGTAATADDLLTAITFV